MKINPDNFTIGIALGTCDDYSLELIQHYIDNFNNNIVVIYREKDPSFYIKHSKVKYVKNKIEKNFNSLINQAVKESDTEYIFWNTWKVKPEYDKFLFGVNKLEQGFGFVDLRSILNSSLFSKHLTSKIGFFDEGYKHNHETDWDLICTLKHFDIAYFDSSVVPLNKNVTMSVGKNRETAWKSYMWFGMKWSLTPNGYVRVFSEKNIKDKFLYKNKFDERKYLPFSESIIEKEYTIKRCALEKSGISLDHLKKDFDDTTYNKHISENLIIKDYN